MQLFSRANVLAALIILGAIGYTASQMLNPSAKQSAAVAPPASVPHSTALPDFSTYTDVKAKKTAFFGSWKERHDLTNQFIEELDKQSGGKVIMPPSDWYTMDSEVYAKTYMEHGSSFHIAPPFYRRNDWGITGMELM